MKLKLSHALAAVALAGLGAAAQARDNVYWSVGIDAAPGVSIGVSNARPVYAAPVYVAPAPVYVAPRPVVIAPQPVYYAAPAPVYYAPVYVHPGKRKGWHKKHHHRGW